MLHLTEADVHGHLDAGELIAALRAAFARDWRSSVRMPARTQIQLASGATLLLMPCDDAEAAGVKIVTVSEAGGVRATYLLLDAETGEVQATIEADGLTDLRTAAISAIATDLLAKNPQGGGKDGRKMIAKELPQGPPVHPVTLGIFGTGRQALAHIRVLPLVRSFERILVCGSSPEKTAAFAREMNPQGGSEDGRETIAKEPPLRPPLLPVDFETCAREADVICTCTASRQPVLRGEWLKPGCHINAVGAFQPTARELDDEAVRRARVVVDTYEGALAEAGDLLIPMGNGIIKRDHIVADLHELVAGKKEVRTSDADITLFKSLGCALEDLVAAQVLMRAYTRQ